MIKFRNIVFAVELGLFAIIGHAHTAEIIVQADTVIEVNGQSLIPDGLFGITAYGGAALPDKILMKETLQRSGIRWVGMPGHAEWLFPETPPPGFAAGWADTDAAAKLLDVLSAKYTIPKNVRGWRDMGIEPMLYLLPGMHGVFKWPESEAEADTTVRPENMPPLFPLSPRDSARVALEWAEYVALVRRADPELTWLHLNNEPQWWYKFDKGGTDYAILFKEIARAIKQRNPGVKIGGPVLCWPPSYPPAQEGQASWYTWTTWAEPLIEIAGEELDFFDFHLYNVRQDNTKISTLGLEEVQTVGNAMWIKTGQRKPVLITEYGVYLKDADMHSAELVWDLRVAPWQSQVMDFLDFQPDKLLSLQPHDLLAHAGGNFTFMKSGDPDDQLSLFKNYQVWAPFCGQRLLTTSSDPEVRVFASTKVNGMTDQARFSLVAVNTSDKTKHMSLRLPDELVIDASAPIKSRFVRLCNFSGSGFVNQTEEGFQDTEMGGVIGGGDKNAVADAGTAVNAEDAEDAVGVGASDPKAASDAAQTATPVADHSRVESGLMVSDGPIAAFVLAPRETRSFEYVLSTPVKLVKKRWTRDVYGDVVHKDFEKVGDSVAVTFDLSELDTDGADLAEVRLGLLGSRKGDRVEMQLGDFVCQIEQQDWFQCVALPAIPQGEKVTAVFTLLARGEPEVRPLLLRFGSATLAFEGNGTFVTPVSSPPATNTSAIAHWSLNTAQTFASRLENPWHVLSQPTPDFPLDRYAAKGVPSSNKLVATANVGLIKSICESVAFRAPKNGWYRFTVSGKLLALSWPTAGNALVTLYNLGCIGGEFKELAEFPLNMPNGYRNYPQDFEWTGTLRLDAGWKFALGLQTVSPGLAGAGSSNIEISRFDVEQLDTQHGTSSTHVTGRSHAVSTND